MKTSKLKDIVFNGLPKEDIIQYILIEFRWVFVVVFLLPCSLLFDLYMWCRHWLIFHFTSAPAAHDSRVRAVQEQVRDWAAREKGRRRMCTARPGWQMTSIRTPLYKARLRGIRVSLVDVLEVDGRRRTVRAEPGVTMGQLTATLVPLGWTIPVVPELDDLTVGGLVNGAGIETSSHRHGLFQHICVAFEIVVADGSLIRCTKDENADLFYCIPWSHGTLGFLVSAELTIIPAKAFVRVEYLPCTSLDMMEETFNREVLDETNDFVEGIVYSLHSGVVMKGQFDDKPKDGKNTNAIGNYYKPWFYKHVEGFLKAPQSSLVEWIPLRHYYHRHTRSLFWELGDILPFGNHPIFRFLLGWLVPPKISFLKLTQPPQIKAMYDKHHLLQDIFVPLSTFKRSLITFHREAMVRGICHQMQRKVDDVELYPLWLCPFKLPALPGLVHPKADKDEMYMDIGAYGNPPLPGFEPQEAVRSIEHYTRSVNGFQMMYADTFMTRAELESMFDLRLYRQVRRRFGADDAFPELYDKLSRAVRH